MKTKIIQEALHQFSSGGYYSTSMQSIAEKCGISKASVYKCFASKEDLLLQVFEYNLNQMLRRATALKSDEHLTKKEQLIEKINVELEAAKEHRPFMNLVLREVPPKKNTEMMAMFKRSKALLMNWHLESLRYAYEDQVQDSLWDLAILLQGTLREYMSLMIDEHKQISARAIAEKVVNQLETVIKHGHFAQPLLTSEIMKDYEAYRMNDERQSFNEQVNQVCLRIRENVENEASAKNHKRLQEAIAHLEEEIKKDQPRQFMIESLGQYIAESVSISSELAALKQLLAAEYRYFQE